MQNLVEKIASAGVVGAGGAGFPTHIKYQKKVEYFILNGAECEPLLQIDQQIMEYYAEEIVYTLKQIKEALGNPTVIIGVKEKYKSAINSLQKAITESGGGINIAKLGNFYPIGDEQILVWECTGRIVPEGGIPLQVGVVVSNAGTVLNIFYALADKPVIKRVVTVAGAVENPFTAFLPIGISLEEVIKLAKPLIKKFKVITGGPMMGMLVKDVTKEVVRKTTTGILIFPEDAFIVQKYSQPFNSVTRRGREICFQCRQCTDLCPRYLQGHRIEPHLAMRHLFLKRDVPHPMAFLCVECGVCEYACPASLSPRRVFQNNKKELTRLGVKNPFCLTPKEVRNFKEYRKVPFRKIIAYLKLHPYINRKAPLKKIDYTPSYVFIPLKQHIGEPSIPVVKEGERVREGELIGETPAGKPGARVHSSIDGYIKKIDREGILIEA